MLRFAFILMTFLVAPAWAAMPAGDCGTLLISAQDQTAGFIVFLIKGDFLTDSTIAKLTEGKILTAEQFEFKNSNEGQILSFKNHLQKILTFNFDKNLLADAIARLQEEKTGNEIGILKSKTDTRPIFHKPVLIKHVLSNQKAKNFFKILKNGKFLFISKDQIPVGPEHHQVVIEELDRYRNIKVDIFEPPQDTQNPFYIAISKGDSVEVLTSNGQAANEFPFSVNDVRDIKLGLQKDKLYIWTNELNRFWLEGHVSSMDRDRSLISRDDDKVVIAHDGRFLVLKRVLGSNDETKIYYEAGSTDVEVAYKDFKFALTGQLNTFLIFSNGTDQYSIYNFAKNKLQKLTSAIPMHSSKPLGSFINEQGQEIFNLLLSGDEIIQWNSHTEGLSTLFKETNIEVGKNIIFKKLSSGPEVFIVQTNKGIAIHGTSEHIVLNWPLDVKEILGAEEKSHQILLYVLDHNNQYQVYEIYGGNY